MSTASMRQENFTLLSQREIAASVYEMKLAGDCSAITTPGQFVNIAVPGFFLRRPISVANVQRYSADTASSDERTVDSTPAAGSAQTDILTLIYKVVGQGTAALAAMEPGTILELLIGLGNGYTLPESGAASLSDFSGKDSSSIKAECVALPASDSSNRSDSGRLLLIGGGVGVPPLYWLARQLRERSYNVEVILGFNSARDVFYEQEFSDLGCSVAVTTADGSYGISGFVTTAMPDANDYAYFYSCGPIPMLKAVAEASGHTLGELSFEERMGCGFGACMGCSHRVNVSPSESPDRADATSAHGADYANADTAHKGVAYKRICVEGPVLRKEEILWD